MLGTSALSPGNSIPRPLIVVFGVAEVGTSPSLTLHYPYATVMNIPLGVVESQDEAPRREKNFIADFRHKSPLNADIVKP